jgi:hypothetical protein
MTFEDVRLHGQSLREPFVVGVEKCDPVAGGGRDAGVASGGGSGIGLNQQTHVVAVRPDDLNRRVGRTVVHDENLVGQKGLGQHAVNGRPIEAALL